ncbi:MAG: ABC transporter permease [Proteobacteria bacterium]|nr:ABC transporter permease [Pseudomonadota bacterium]MBU1389475.1 ABC transporter permease [Pseudomonadota bacterium]MBU1541295.1 ABC transporter permease [Pseudomonadota bacterium]
MLKKAIPKTDESHWDLIITPKNGWFDINIGELFRYRDLIYMFIRRDFVTFYKQTILGPLWYIIQPLVNTLVFTIVFGKVAKISTDGTPPFLFYMTGTIAWSYFSTCLTATSNTFGQNANIFGKVYFPRLTVPVAHVIINLLQFGIQFVVFIGFWLWFKWQGADFHLGNLIFAIPLVLLQMAVLGLGFGILISSLTTKYRDLTFAMGFGVQLWMYATPIVYPLSVVPEKYHMLASLNPMTSVVECFRGAFLGVSSIQPVHIIISVAITLIAFFAGIILFSRIEKTFMDTV